LETDWWLDDDVQNYIQTEWDSLEYSRAALYSHLIFCAIRIIKDEEFEFFLPHPSGDDEHMSQQDISAISLLYSVRKPNHNLHAASIITGLSFHPATPTRAAKPKTTSRSLKS
jgi:hypothetical protein